MKEKLKPCAHCGSPRVSAWYGLVQCGECHTTISGDTQEAVTAWNRRVVTPEQVEAAAIVHDDILFKEKGVYDSMEYAKMIITRVFEAAGFEVKA